MFNAQHYSHIRKILAVLSVFSIGLVLVVASSLNTRAEDYKEIKICNYTTRGAITLALVRYRDDEWWGEGWWTLSQGDCATIYHNGDYFYWYADFTNSDLRYSGKHRFCVTDTKFKYRVDEATCANGHYVKFIKRDSRRRHTQIDLDD